MDTLDSGAQEMLMDTLDSGTQEMQSTVCWSVMVPLLGWWVLLAEEVELMCNHQLVIVSSASAKEIGCIEFPG